VRGDPTSDIKLLQDRDNLLMIMKDGVRYKHSTTELPGLPVSRGSAVRAVN
jgi:hypothetical protein